MSSRPSTVEVRIRNIAFGGDGVGEVIEELGVDDSTLRGMTAFVPYTAIGERVTARVEDRKRNHLRCESGEITEQSVDRVVPACSYFGTCGGCHFQHISSESQLEIKRSMLLGALRVARCSHTVMQAVRPLVSGDMMGYRRRLRLHVNPKGQVGFYQPKSRTVVPVTDCLVADAKIRAILPQLESFALLFSGSIGSVLLESDDEGVIAALVAPFSLGEQEARKLLNDIKHVLPNCSVHVAGKEIARSGRKFLSLPLPMDISLSVSATGFSQANWPINTLLIERCVELLRVDSNSKVYDLYSGAGNFSLPVASIGKQVVAVEQEKDLIRWGQETARNFDVASNLTYVNSSVEAFCKKSPFEKGCSIIADPPRSGLGKLVAALSPASSLYFISCSLPSFVRDLKQLLELGWEVESIEPFDMFPQTTHMEILGVFRSKR